MASLTNGSHCSNPQLLWQSSASLNAKDGKSGKEKEKTDKEAKTSKDAKDGKALVLPTAARFTGVTGKAKMFVVRQKDARWMLVGSCKNQAGTSSYYFHVPGEVQNAREGG